MAMKNNPPETDVQSECVLQAPCFQISSTVELKEIPTTGEEYLLKVMNERQKCLAVTKCNEDLTRFAKNQSLFVKELLPTRPAPDLFKPTTEWQNIQVADFSEVRMYVSRMQSKKSQWPCTVTRIDIVGRDPIAWKRFFNSNTPTLSCVFGLSQTILDNGLDILINSLDSVQLGETIDPKTGRWIYAFLACLHLPLLSDTISMLRTLARKCAEIRYHIRADDESTLAAVAPLNVFICLVARYFRQTDMTDS